MVPATHDLHAIDCPAAEAEEPLDRRRAWSAVGSMALCVAMLIASEFMPVSLLTPIASDLGVSEGMAGQAVTVSGLFAVVSSVLIPSVASRWDRRYVLMALTAVMLVSLVVIARASSFAPFIAARALLGITIGGFWALSTATVMRLVPAADVPRALGVLYTGNAVATAFAAPIGSYVGAIVGWRGVFHALVPLVLLNLIWQWLSLPSLPPRATGTIGQVFALLRRPDVAFGMLGVMLTFAGAFAAFTYFRPFLEGYTRASVPELSLVLLGLGVAGFAGTYGATALLRVHLYRLLRWLPLALAASTVALLAVGHTLWAVAVVMVVWGALNSAIPVSWSTWLSRGIRDEPEAGGGLMVAAIQLAIMLGAAAGGALLDHLSIAATLIGGALLLCGASLVVGKGHRLGADLSDAARP
jgi:predicted MFS family arabinose efflux permease